MTGHDDGHGHFELRRLSDDLVYSFVRATDPSGQTGYRREDRPDLWIVRTPDWGWIARDPQTGAIAGRSWETPPSSQGDHPPPGIWVSRKGEKSYVYDLIYPGAMTR